MIRKFLFASLAAAFATIAAFAMIFDAPAVRSAHMAFFDGPVLAPVDELRLQIALAVETPMLADAALLNRALRDTDIRTALEDTARLHFDLG